MHVTGSRHRLAVLLGVLVLAAVAGFGLGRRPPWLWPSSSPEVELAIPPPGFWTATRPAGVSGPAGTTDPEERARLVSLPYLGGRLPAPEAGEVGVVYHQPDHVRPGLNLYNSGHGPEARLMDMDGRLLHRWRYPFERAFPGVAPNTDTTYFRRVHLFPDGRLVGLYQTGGLVFLDRDSRLLGRCRGSFYNDLWVGEGGRIWTLAKEAEVAAAGEKLDDFLVELRYDEAGGSCRETRRISITDAFLASPFGELLQPMAAAGDVLHANTISVIGGPGPFEPGHLLISLREVDLLAVVDPEAERVVWAQRGPWRAQHEPTLLDTGRILLFDNRGGGHHSRLLELVPATGRLAWSWTASPPSGFYSSQGGSCARLDNGNTLVTESVPGRAFELDPEGRVVWEFRTPHRAGRDRALVAMLFEVQRVPERYRDALGS